MSERSELLLMVDPVGDQVFPVSPRAFSVITSPRARILARNCVALFLDAGGTVRRITGVETPGAGFLRRMRLFFGLPVRAEFAFEVVDAPLEDIRLMVLDAMTYSRAHHGVDPEDWWLMRAPEDEIRTELARANSLADLHARIRFPSDADCLDLL